jgi:uncharacterized membrane protein YgaE (UPF0421/DUF939 family)
MSWKALQTWASTSTGILVISLAKTAFRLAIASAISYALAAWWNWEYPFYAVIAAIIVMGSTVGSTRQSGINRLIGTVVGAFSGALFAVALGSNAWSLAVCVFLTIFLSSLGKLGEAAKLAGYVSAIVILTHQDSAWIYAWGRLLETLLGVAVALIVHRAVFPVHTDEELRRCLADTLVNLKHFYQFVVDCALTGKYEKAEIDPLKEKIIASL